jgi:peptidoglycan/LPS O-acetylase OafA/YrhL
LVSAGGDYAKVSSKSISSHSVGERIQTLRQPRQHYPGLDGLRGIAILAVFLFHYGYGGIHSSSAAVRSIALICGLGWSGVDLFFVLSGFLITGILLDTRLEENYYRNFYARRVLRIFPIYYLLALILFLYYPHWRPLHLTFLVYLGFPAALVWPWLIQIPAKITHLWSLAVEEQFYLVWPVIVRRLSRIALLNTCVVMIAFAFLLRCVFEFYAPDWAYPFLLSRMDTLAVGAVIAISMRDGNLDTLRKWAPLTSISSAAVLILICGIRHSVDRRDALIATVGYSDLAILYGSLLILGLSGRVKELLSFAPLRTVGKYSYGLYLYHFPLEPALEPLRPWLIAELHSFALGAGLYVIICLGINLLVAAISFHFIESPILQIKSRFK